MNKRILLFRLSCILVAMFIVSGCGVHRPKTDPLLDQKAFALSRQLKSHNDTINSSKGTGWAVIETPEKKERFRIAWAAVYPNKIRMTFLLSGLPIETIIATGEHITFFSHNGQHARKSYPASDPDMGKYIQVPVRMSQIILMLLGRFPIKEFDDAFFSAQNTLATDITLRKSHERQMQYLSFKQTGELDQIAVTDFIGEPLYRTTIKKYKSYGSADIPAQMEIRDRLGRKLTLNITSFKANPPLKEGVFQLTGPG